MQPQSSSYVTPPHVLFYPFIKPLYTQTFPSLSATPCGLVALSRMKCLQKTVTKGMLFIKIAL